MFAGKIGSGHDEEFKGFNASDGRYGIRRKLITVPHYITANFKGKKIFETGSAGLAVDGEYIFLFIAGYRIHPLKAGRFNLRLNAVYPLTTPFETSFFIFPFGFSSGIVFESVQKLFSLFPRIAAYQIHFDKKYLLSLLKDVFY